MLWMFEREKRKINTKLEVLSFKKAREEIEIDINDITERLRM